MNESILGRIHSAGRSAARNVEVGLNIDPVPAQIPRQVNMDYPVMAFLDSNQRQISLKESMINGNTLAWRKILM